MDATSAWAPTYSLYGHALRWPWLLASPWGSGPNSGSKGAARKPALWPVPAGASAQLHVVQYL
jgi:hypothetical protein